MTREDLIALDDSGVELSSPAGSAAHAPAPRREIEIIDEDKQIEEVKCRSCGHVDRPRHCSADEHSGMRLIHERDCMYVLFENECDCQPEEQI